MRQVDSRCTQRHEELLMRLALLAVMTVLALLSSCTRANRMENVPPDRSPANRELFRTAEGLTMAVIRGPVEFRMGSPDGEVGRNPAVDSPDEAQHTERIPRSYAISMHEVTVAQFRRLLDAHPEAKSRHAYADDPSRM